MCKLPRLHNLCVYTTKILLLTKSGAKDAIALIIGHVYFLIVFLFVRRIQHSRLSVVYVSRKYNVHSKCFGSYPTGTIGWFRVLKNMKTHLAGVYLKLRRNNSNLVATHVRESNLSMSDPSRRKRWVHWTLAEEFWTNMCSIEKDSILCLQYGLVYFYLDISSTVFRGQHLTSHVRTFVTSRSVRIVL